MPRSPADSQGNNREAPVERLRWSSQAGAFLPEKEAAEEKAQARRGLFIKGPLPLWWLQQASKLTDCALAVGLYIWFQRGFGHERITVSSTRMRHWGVGKKGLRSALSALEAAGLLAVERAPGRAARVTVLKGSHSPREAR